MVTKGNKIDNLIADQYTSRNYSELKALSRLFSSSFMSGLKSILEEGKTKHKRLKYEFEIQHSWIDKIPLAQFENPVNDHYGNPIDLLKRVELGDMLIVYNYFNEYLHRSEDKIVKEYRDSSAIIIQAKKSTKRMPKVPITILSSTNPNSSTNKELALMSDWPEFNLFKASRSKTPLLNNLNINNGHVNGLFAGYFEKAWDTGIPKFGADCNKSMGNVIEELVNRKIGQKCDLQLPTNDWDKLISTILNLTKNLNAPRTMERSWNRLVSSNFPLLFFFFFIKPKPRFNVLVINEIMAEGDHLENGNLE